MDRMLRDRSSHVSIPRNDFYRILPIAVELGFWPKAEWLIEKAPTIRGRFFRALAFRWDTETGRSEIYP